MGDWKGYLTIIRDGPILTSGYMIKGTEPWMTNS